MKRIITILFIALGISANAQCWGGGSVNNRYVALIKTDGTLWHWGNLYGGGPQQDSSPIQVGTDNNWDMVGVGENFAIAKKQDGTLWAWGDNSNGHFGDGTSNNQSNPIQIGTANDWDTIKVGLEHVVARKTNGTLWTWGVTAVNLVPGSGVTVTSFLTTPTQVGTSADWGTAKIDAGGYHTLIVKGNGTLWGWGNNSVGQLGNGTNNSTTTPVQIGTDSDWSMVGPAWGSSFAIKTNGKLYAWGIADIRLGLGNISANVTIPTQVGTDTDWKSVKGGNRESTAIKNSGALYTWGHNELGQLGDGTITDRNTPTHIGTDTDWMGSGAANDQIYGLKTNGTLYVVGDNQYGSLGTGNTTNLTVLTPLTCPTSALETVAFEAKPSFAIYPNPASSMLNIQTSNNVNLTKVIIIDTTGKRVIEQTQNITQVNVEQLASGMYILQAFSGEKKFISKFVKE